ncbi:tigger transposable element-derived protein 4-like [Metopolophium dirhodum]|uniref:tigger transposable element-derived protein 4-like n=1 Tax=Metopolophium dirhodum TaxID=44670 RepID=UPI0029902D14|nr:tigger transposable element-derived protein 4-like [Metopolophium dirhodum]
MWKNEKNEIKEQWMNGNGRMKRKSKSNANEEINNLTWEWFASAIAKNIPIFGPIIQTKARQIAEQMSITEFKASNTWLESFKNRHKIVYHQICGEFEKPLVIGKSQKPRCFKKFPIIWRANNKAWMTGSIMEDWFNIQQ